MAVLASGLVGVFSGFGAIFWHARRVTDALTHRRFTLAVGIGLTVLAASLFRQGVGDRPLFAIVGTAVGLAVAWWLPHWHADLAGAVPRSLIGSVLVTIAVHRAFEGIVLAAGLRAGATLGTMSFLLITVHAAGETAILGGLLAIAGRARDGILAVLVVQGGFVVAATTAAMVAVMVPPMARSVVLTVTAGIVAYVGIHECMLAFRDRRRRTG